MHVILINKSNRSKKKLPHLDIHEVIHADTPQFRELLPAFLEERRYLVAFLALHDAHGYTCNNLCGQMQCPMIH